MLCLSPATPLAQDAVRAIQTGNLVALQQLLRGHPDLATARIGDASPGGITRTLLHIATDWPGHYPNGAAIVGVLAAAGADVNAPFTGPHAETPLHWAASSNDVAVLDALLDAGADIEAAGAVLGGGPPLADATGFRQWAAAQRLVARGARTTLRDAATMGLQDRLEESFAGTDTAPTEADINHAFWREGTEIDSVAARTWRSAGQRAQADPALGLTALLQDLTWQTASSARHHAGEAWPSARNEMTPRTLDDDEFSFTGPGSPEVLEAWRTRLGFMMPRFLDRFGDEARGFDSALLQCLASREHRSHSRVWCVLACAPDVATTRTGK
jgi:hypothetical protein